MPSVFTIEGTSPAPRKRKRSSKRKAKATNELGNTPRIGDCKTVKNPRTGCSMQLCFVGKSRSAKTGWKFQKGSSSCAAKRR
jgi:hypothetical protein